MKSFNYDRYKLNQKQDEGQGNSESIEEVIQTGSSHSSFEHYILRELKHDIVEHVNAGFSEYLHAVRSVYGSVINRLVVDQQA